MFLAGGVLAVGGDLAVVVDRGRVVEGEPGARRDQVVQVLEQPAAPDPRPPARGRSGRHEASCPPPKGETAPIPNTDAPQQRFTPLREFSRCTSHGHRYMTRLSRDGPPTATFGNCLCRAKTHSSSLSWPLRARQAALRYSLIKPRTTFFPPLGPRTVAESPEPRHRGRLSASGPPARCPATSAASCAREAMSSLANTCARCVCTVRRDT